MSLTSATSKVTVARTPVPASYKPPENETPTTWPLAGLTVTVKSGLVVDASIRVTPVATNWKPARSIVLLWMSVS